jgi:hypothetical protein
MTELQKKVEGCIVTLLDSCQKTISLLQPYTIENTTEADVDQPTWKIAKSISEDVARLKDFLTRYREEFFDSSDKAKIAFSKKPDHILTFMTWDYITEILFGCQGMFYSMNENLYEFVLIDKSGTPTMPAPSFSTVNGIDHKLWRIKIAGYTGLLNSYFKEMERC